MRSFRGQLARRTAIAAGGLVAAMAIISYLVLARLLRNDLDGTLRQIAEYEAAAAASTDEQEFHFHEAVLLGLQDAELPELTRFAQLLDLTGHSLVRSRSLASPVNPPREAVERVAGQGRPAFISHLSGRVHLRSLIFPIRLSGPEQSYLLHVAAPTQPLRDTLFAFTMVLASLTLVGTGLGFWLGWQGAEVALRPVNEITGQAAALGPASLAARITAQNDVTEFKQLVGVLNDMLDRLERTLEGQKRFTADASHELRGPLNVLRGEIDVALLRNRSGEEYREFLARCHAEVIRLTRLAQDLLLLARADGGALEPSAGADRSGRAGDPGGRAPPPDGHRARGDTGPQRAPRSCRSRPRPAGAGLRQPGPQRGDPLTQGEHRGGDRPGRERSRTDSQGQWARNPRSGRPDAVRAVLPGRPFPAPESRHRARPRDRPGRCRSTRRDPRLRGQRAGCGLPGPTAPRDPGSQPPSLEGSTALGCPIPSR